MQALPYVAEPLPQHSCSRAELTSYANVHVQLSQKDEDILAHLTNITCEELEPEEETQQYCHCFTRQMSCQSCACDTNAHVCLCSCRRRTRRFWRT